MAVRETHILIDVMADADPLREMNREINNLVENTQDISGDTMRDLNDEMLKGSKYSRDLKYSYYGLTDESKRMMREMKYGWQGQNKEFLKFKNQMVAAKYGYFQLAKASDDYKGTTKDLMRDVERLGKIHKTATDGMINNNKRYLQSLYMQAGTMMNLTTQAKRITESYDRMNNPLLNVNKNSLKVADSLNRVANRGNAAVLALSILGPTAGIKQLKDMTMMLNQGIMRMGMVALGAAVSTALLGYALVKMAKGARVEDVLEEQAQALQAYKDAVVDRTREISEAWSLFEDIQLNSTSPAQLMANLQEQVTAMKEWQTNLNSIAEVAGKDFADYLSSLGPTAAGEVAAISSMSEPELNKYVALWKEKMGLSKEVATTELENLKKETQAKIQELQGTLTPFGEAWYRLKNAVLEALKPMVQAFGMVTVPIMNFIAKMAELVAKFNEAHPTIALMVQGVLMLIPLLTLILSPLAAGVGLLAGFKLALGAIWPIIAPVVTGLAAMSSTVWLVAAALVAVVAGIIWLWNNVQGFRDFVIAAWTWIKDQTIIIWNAILLAITPAIQAIVTFVSVKLAEIKAFWSAHGAEIMAVVSIFMAQIKGVITIGMGLIKGVFQATWPVIQAIVEVAWGLIKMVIDNAIALIQGVITAGLAVIKGDWEGAWNAIKGIAVDIMNNIISFFQSIDLTSIGKNIIQGLINGISSMAGAAMDAAKGVANSVKNAVAGALKIHSPSRVMIEYGGFVTEGLGLGIKDGTEYVQKMAMDMNHAIPTSYTPETTTGSSNTNNSTSITLSPVIHINSTDETGEGKGVKQQVKEAMNEVFEYLNVLYEPEGEY